MAETLPTPRATPDVEEGVQSDDARGAPDGVLDELLKRYLLLLDQYTYARQQLSVDLASGYISLAQANFNPSNRVRYGQDFYDDRMQALRRIVIDERDSKLQWSTRLVESPEEPFIEIQEKQTASSVEEVTGDKCYDPADAIIASLGQISLAEKTASDGQLAGTMPEKGELSAEVKQDKTTTSRISRADDPIRWFGILVPPQLRSAQDSFVQAVENPIPKLVDLAGRIRELEVEVRRTRKDMAHGKG